MGTNSYIEGKLRKSQCLHVVEYAWLRQYSARTCLLRAGLVASSLAEFPVVGRGGSWVMYATPPAPLDSPAPFKFIIVSVVVVIAWRRRCRGLLSTLAECRAFIRASVRPCRLTQVCREVMLLHAAACRCQTGHRCEKSYQGIGWRATLATAGDHLIRGNPVYHVGSQ